MINHKNKIKFLNFVSAAVFFLLLFLPSTSVAKMVGPYDGQVIDSRTGKPIHKASVLICWEKGSKLFPDYSELVKAVLVHTDGQGRYRVPRQLLQIGLTWWLGRMVIIIYQPGYQAYIKDRWESEATALAHKGNIVRLKRVPPGFNHFKHHSRITNALQGLDDLTGGESINGRPLAFGSLMKRNAIKVELWRFLRRIEWEEKRRSVK